MFTVVRFKQGLGGPGVALEGWKGKPGSDAMAGSGYVYVSLPSPGCSEILNGREMWVSGAEGAVAGVW